MIEDYTKTCQWCHWCKLRRGYPNGAREYQTFYTCEPMGMLTQPADTCSRWSPCSPHRKNPGDGGPYCGPYTDAGAAHAREEYVYEGGRL